MKTFTRFAAVAAALTIFVSAPSAFAAERISTPSAGHYEWRAQPSFGPRAPMHAPVRIWVSDSEAMAASCNCTMMHDATAQAAGCMSMSTTARNAAQG